MELKEIRKEKKMSQSKLANKVGVHPVNISRYEKGVRTPTLAIFDKICEALELNNKNRMDLLKSMSKKE